MVLILNDKAYRPVPRNVGNRVSGSIADFVFEEGADPLTVYDLETNPYNLTINDMGNVTPTWETGGAYPALTITEPCEVFNTAGFSKFIDLVKAGGAGTIEVWVRPSAVDLYGPARLVNISDPADPTLLRNVMVGMNDGSYNATGGKIRNRLRTEADPATFPDIEQGIPEVVTASTAVDSATIHHIVFTFDTLDGERVYASELGGSFSGIIASQTQKIDTLGNWGTWGLILFNEFDNAGAGSAGGHQQRTFTGDAHRVTFYPRALTPQEVQQNFDALPDGTGVLPAPELSWSAADYPVNSWDGSFNVRVQGTAPLTDSVELTLSSTAQLSFDEFSTVLTTDAVFSGTTFVDVPVYITDAPSGTGEIADIDISAAGAGEWTLGTSAATVTVTENNVASTIGWAGTTSTAAVDGVVNIPLSGDLAYEPDVTLTVAATGTPSALGYTLGTAPVMLGNTVQTNLEVTFDGTDVADETLELTITALSDSAVIGTAVHTITLSDSEFDRPGINNTGPWLYDTDGTTEVGNNLVYAAIIGARPTVVDTGAGLPTPVGLTYSNFKTTGNVYATADNQVFENFITSGRVNDQGFANVQFRNYQQNRNISTSGTDISSVLSGAGSLLSECEVTGGKNGAKFHAASNGALRMNLHNAGADGIKDDGHTDLDYVWVHLIGTSGTNESGANVHGDCLQIRSGTLSHYYRCNFDCPFPGTPGALEQYPEGHNYHTNAAIQCEAENGNTSNLLIEECYLNGGSKTVRNTAAAPPLTNTGNHYLNCRFGRDNQSGLFQTSGLPAYGDVTLTNCVYDDDGTPIPHSSIS